MIVEPMVLMERGRGGSPNLEFRQDGTSNAILTPNGGRGGLGVGALAFGWQNSASQGDSASEHITPTLDKSKTPAVAFPIDSMNHLSRQDHHSLGDFEANGPQYTLTKNHSHAVATASAVRRLTPRECERLQGFPDDYTLITHRGKPAADGPRYKALGNSMAVNVMRVIGERIALIDAMNEARAAA